MADTNRGLGALTGGFQQGYEMMGKSRRNKQYEKLMQQEIQKGEYELAGNEAVAAEASGMPTPARQAGLPDTYLDRFTSWIGSKLGAAQAPAAEAPPAGATTGGQPAPVDLGGAAGGMGSWKGPGAQGGGVTTRAIGGGFAQPGAGGEFAGPQGQAQDYRQILNEREKQQNLNRQGYADGGVIDPEDAKKAAERSRAADRARMAEDAAKPKSEPSRYEKVKQGAKKAAIQGKAEITSSNTRAGKAARGAGKLGAAAALGTTAYDVWNTPTEDYRKRFGLELGKDEDPSLIGEMMIRSLGAASDLGNNLTFGYAGQFYRDKQEQEPAPRQAIAEPEGMWAPSTLAAQPAQQAPRQAINADRGQDLPPPSAGFGQGGGGVDWRGADWLPDDMPTMPTKDWEKYRNTVVQARILQGKSAAEAHQEVTAVQMQGFQRFGMEAAQLLQAGDPAAAARALKAAYQYFPNGADVKFGMQNDRSGQPALIGMGFDEKTGEPTGTPMLINAERMNAMLDNLSDPGKWLAWTKDWREEAAKDKEYEEVTKPAAEAKLETDRMAAEANVNRSQASLERARASGRSTTPSLKQTDIRAAEDRFVDRLMMDEVIGENQADVNELASLMAQVFVETGGEFTLSEVYQRLTNAYRQGEDMTEGGGMDAVYQTLESMGAEFDDGTP